MNLRARLALVLWLLLGAGQAALAHESMPASLRLQAQSEQVLDVRWRLPQTQGPAPRVAPIFPPGCVALEAAQTDVLPGARLAHWRMRCPQGLGAGERIEFPGLEATMVDVVVRFEDTQGRVSSHIARPRSPWVMLGEAPAQSLAVASYFGLGVEHILTGTDHLLFVFCLILLIPRLGGLLKTITAFTLAHSITLALAALGWVRVAQAPVEATIALSIVFLARELVLRARAPAAPPGLSRRRPWAVAFVFGLLHGFGFAGALAEVGLPQGDIPMALLLFNLGVEAGQLAFVLLVVPLVWWVRRLDWGRVPWLRWTPVYGAGAMAGFWCLQRMGAVLVPLAV